MTRGKMDGIRKVLSITACLLVLVMSFGAPAYAQDEEPRPTEDPAQLVPNDPTAPQDNADEEESTPEPTQPPADEEEDEPDAEEEDSGNEGSSNQPRLAERAEDAAGPGAPAVLAHGLAYMSGDDVVWQVRELEVPDVSDASSDSTDEAVLLQRDGTSIVRNDATGKRALLDPGEAYFRAADDPYTVMTEGSGSIIWHFELVDPDDVALDAFYESPVIEDVDEGVYDMMLTRYVLQPGESADLPDHNGAGMVMVTSGEVRVDMDGDLSALESGDGQSLQGDTMVTNDGSRPAVFAYVYLGEEVGDASAGAPQSTATTSDDSDDSDGTEGTTGTTGDTLQGEADPAADTQEAAPSSDESGAFITSINVTADAEIYLVITVDGLTVFDGTLPAGSSSGPVVGSTFEVYTSSGVNTNFTNACGETFKMGYEEGEAYYSLSASAESCAP
ncbi:MAG TPA: hypothetical protein VKZ61_03355 [Thermomicrobiales bacterium]|jgi:hypothetical protein|nr:hypothetical protein [Thermomicrobiales bacterium]